MGVETCTYRKTEIFVGVVLYVLCANDQFSQERKVWLRMTRFFDLCNVFSLSHLSQKASVEMNTTFLGTSCQNGT